MIRCFLWWPHLTEAWALQVNAGCMTSLVSTYLDLMGHRDLHASSSYCPFPLLANSKDWGTQSSVLPTETIRGWSVGLFYAKPAVGP